MIRSKALPLFKLKNEWYKSVKISLKEVADLCDDCPYFYLMVGNNPYKEEDDTRPEKIFFIKSGK